MIESKLEELFNSIENSSLYKEYKKIEKILDKDEEIKIKADELNNKQIYQEYLSRMEEFNNELAMSSKMINDYIEEKV